MNVSLPVRICRGILPMLACAALAATAAPRSPTGSPTMNEAQSKALALLQLSDEQHFALDPAGVAALQARLANQAGAPLGAPGAAPVAPPPLLVLAAPTKVLANQVGRIPVLVAAQFSARREWETNYAPNRLLVISNLLTGEVHAGNAQGDERTRKPPPSRTGPPPSAERGADGMTSLTQLDLVNLLGSVQGATQLGVTALYYDWKSNTVPVRIEGRAPTKPVVTRRSNSVVRQVDPRTTFKPDTPSAVSTGASFKLPPSVAAGAAIPLQAIVSLPLAEAGLLTADAAKPPELMPVTVLLVQHDDTSPLKLESAALALQVPASGGGKLAQAVFEVDLQTLAGTPISPGAYQVYLLVGARMAGPTPLIIGH